MCTRRDTAPHFGHAASGACALAVTSSSPAGAVTASTITPARWGSRTPRSTEPGHDKNTSPCDNDTTDSWKNSRLRQPLDYQESTHFTRQLDTHRYGARRAGPTTSLNWGQIREIAPCGAMTRTGSGISTSPLDSDYLKSYSQIMRTLPLPSAWAGPLPEAAPPPDMAIYQLPTGTYETRAAFAVRGGSFRDKRHFAALFAVRGGSFRDKRHFAATAILVQHPKGD